METPLDHVAALWPGYLDRRPLGNKAIVRPRSDHGWAQTRRIRGPKGARTLELVRRVSSTSRAANSALADEILFISTKQDAGSPEEQFAAIEAYLQSLAGAPDCYVSVNSFFGRRWNENLKHLTCLMVDLDLGKALERGRDFAGDFMAMRQEALDALSGAGIPMPNLCTHTGRGVHLYWLFDRAVPAAAVTRWRACLKVLIELLRPIGADDLRDAARVLRLVGTVNTKAPAHCRRVTAEVLVPTRVSFDFLADQILPLTRAELAEVRAARLIELAPKRAQRDALRQMRALTPGGPPRNARSFSAKATARQTDLNLLAVTLFPNGITEGNRDRYLFATTCNLAWMCREESLVDEILAWKQRHIPDMTDREALTSMGSAIRKAQEASKAAGAKVRAYEDPRYIHSSVTLWQRFGDDIERAGLTDRMQAILPEGVLKERQRQARRAKSADHYTGRGIREGNVPRALQAQELRSHGQSLREIARALGVTPKTISSWLELPPEALGLGQVVPQGTAPAPAPAQPDRAIDVAAPTTYPQTARVLPFERPVSTKCSVTSGSAERVPAPASSMQAAKGGSGGILRLLPDFASPAGTGQDPSSPAHTRFDSGLLAGLRSWPLQRALDALDLHFKVDASYAPRKSEQRIHVTTDAGLVVELVLSGVQWFDTRTKKGGGGVIDLVMHLRECDFVTAVRSLLPFFPLPRPPTHD